MSSAPLSVAVLILSAMAYDEDLAERLRECIAGEKGVTEKKMFGGLAFLINGNMAVAASGQGGMLLRCDPADTDKLVTKASVDRMVMRGRAMDGWLRVDASRDQDRQAARNLGRPRRQLRQVLPKK